MKAWNTDSELETLVHFPGMEIERPFQRHFLPRERKSKAPLAWSQNDFVKLEAVTFLENQGDVGIRLELMGFCLLPLP